ncbi:MAG: DUF11 domain-containing protein, partial [Luteimonas sp.]
MPAVDKKEMWNTPRAISPRTGGLFCCLIALSLLATTNVFASTLVRGFTPRFSVTTRGDLLVIGNTVMTCPGTSAICAPAQNGVSVAAANNNNNAHDMVWINTDAVTTSPENSSRATLTIPGGSTVLFAGLYWGADTSAGTNGSAAPTPANRNQVRFATPASGFAITTAAQVDISGSRYSGFADVTARVQAGGGGLYRVSGVQAGRGQDRYAGWTLVVIVANASLPPRNMVVFDGYATINSTAPTSITTTVSGFRTPPAGAVNSRVGFIGYEGDLGSTGDNFRLNTTNLTDALNPSGNVFNSTVTSQGTRFANKEPDYVNQLGYDADFLTANGVLANNATSADITFTTGGETYFPAAILFSTVVFEPVLATNLVKSVTDVNGGSVAPGDVLEYTVAYGNTGNDGATNVVLTDVVPANTTYVPNSLNIVAGPNAGAKTDAADGDQANLDLPNNRVVFRLGTGADGINGGVLSPGVNGSVRFRVQVAATAAEGTVIPNTAQQAFRSQSLDEALT